MVEMIHVDVTGTMCSCFPASLFVNKLNETVLARELISEGIFNSTNELTLHGNVEMFLKTAKINTVQFE